MADTSDEREVREAMTVSMKVMSAGDGYKYLLKSVVAADGNRALSNQLTRYYVEAGTPPGRWLGRAIHAIGEGVLSVGDPVTGEQLALLLGAGRDPVTGEQLGLAFPQYASIRDRVASRAAGLSVSLSADQRADAIREIESEEKALGESRAVAGFDFTFSVPKSVSVLWGVTDAGTQALIVEAHHAAVAEVMDLLERDVAATRVGRNNGTGAVAQAKVVGVVAAAFDHWDSRLGDPQLHTHVVISNKVKTVGDGKWRSLDSRPLHAAVVALSEHYNAVLADRITRQFGLDWEQRQRGKDRNLSWELALVSDRLVREFSGRAHAIEVEKDKLIEDYVVEHGEQPSRTTVIRLRAQATLATRPEKQVRALGDLTDAWRIRADPILERDSLVWARGLTKNATSQQRLRADDVSLNVIELVGGTVVAAVSQKRSTWRHWNLWAEASRQTMGWRFATVDDREKVVRQVVEAAEHQSLQITPPELAVSPRVFRRQDGSSQFRPRHSIFYSSTDLLAAEDRLLARAEDVTAPTVTWNSIKRHARGTRLTAEQEEVLARIAASGRRIDLLIGPAGAGKTTTMRALRQAWQDEHGDGSVVGLAPSAAAAQVLADDLQIACENTAKWLYESDHGRTALRDGQLVIVDEATLSGTLALDRITGIAELAGAKVLLVGDWAQLQSVDAGGAFNLLAATRDDAPELTELHRFTHTWEKTASLDLRHGRAAAIDTYICHDRVREGATAQMIDAAYLGWRADARAGRESILITDSAHSVIELNNRARAERILEGDTNASREVRLADGTCASPGDLIISRSNDRRLTAVRGGWVRNGDRWRVLSAGRDGSLHVERSNGLPGGSVTLPAAYVAESVELGYAVTTHRAQGVTVDSAHVVVSAATTRENLYVSMTRGRSSNIAYVTLDRPDASHTAPIDRELSARSVLYGVLQHSGAELSAHQTIEAELERWSSIAQIAAEYDTIAGVAQRDRWIDLLTRAGLTDDQLEDMLCSGSFGPLAAELRRAEANHLDLEAELPRLVGSRSFSDAVDVGAVLFSRLQRVQLRRHPQARGPQGFIAGLIPIARGPMQLDMLEALTQRRELIERRADALIQRALSQQERWLRRLGALPPAGTLEREGWLQELRAVVVYRDRYHVGSDPGLGVESSEAQRRDRAQPSERFDALG